MVETFLSGKRMSYSRVRLLGSPLCRKCISNFIKKLPYPDSEILYGGFFITVKEILNNHPNTLEYYYYL